MRAALLTLLACPDCGAEIRFRSLDAFPHDQAWLGSGTLACSRCAREFPIEGGIPRLYPQEAQERRVKRTQRSFAWEWLRYPGSLPEDRDVFLQETQIAPEEWRGKTVLDAGCGMGRYALVARNLGARVVAFDLSDSIRRLAPAAAEDPGLDLVQGDLLRPPFKAEVFDVVYSQGVLHHTRDTARAFARVARLARRGGRVSAWVYGTPGPWASFSTNPLRQDRGWLRRVLPAVWTFVWARQLLSDLLRVVTTRLPVPLLYALCYPLAALGAVPGLRYLTFSVHPRFGVRLTENFDWLAPPFQHKHTKEEMRLWYRRAGLTVLRQLAHGVVPKVGFLGRKD